MNLIKNNLQAAISNGQLDKSQSDNTKEGKKCLKVLKLLAKSKKHFL